MVDGGRSKLIAAAQTLIAQKGFHQTRMAELTHLSGISVGQIYRLFANKSEMIIAIVQDDTEKRIQRLAAIRDDVAAGVLAPETGVERAILQALQESSEALNFEVLAEGLRNPVVADVVGSLCENLRAILGELILKIAPELTGSRLLAAEEMLLAITFGLGNNTLSRPVLSSETSARHAAEMIVAMLKALEDSCKRGV